MGVRWPVRRDTLRQDSVAGLVLGVQSVPDGLATGLLAGVSPLAGLYAYLVGTVAGAAATSSVFMAIQGTGAMAMIITDVPAVHSASDPATALFTLSVLTGVVMIVAGPAAARRRAALRVQRGDGRLHQRHRRQHHPGPALELHRLLGAGRQPHHAGARRPSPARRCCSLTTVAIGVATIVLIVVLERTRVGAMGLVVAVVVTSGLAYVLGWADVATLNDLGDVPELAAAPRAAEPGRWCPRSIVPALSLAFVGLVQGASISAQLPEPRRHLPRPVPRLHRAGRGQRGLGRASRGCRSAARCRRRRSTRRRAPARASRWSSRAS